MHTLETLIAQADEYSEMEVQFWQQQDKPIIAYDTAHRWNRNQARAALQSALQEVLAERDRSDRRVFEMRVMLDEMGAERDALAKDAARMEHLRQFAKVSSLDINGNHSWTFNYGKGWKTGATFREAIDNDMKGQTP